MGVGVGVSVGMGMGMGMGVGEVCGGRVSMHVYNYVRNG